MADDQDAGDAAHRYNGEVTWALEKDEQKKKRHRDVGADLATTDMRAGEAGDTVIGRKLEKAGPGQDRQGDESKACRRAAQSDLRVAVRAHSLT
jgi:hypothetical protein